MLQARLVILTLLISLGGGLLAQMLHLPAGMLMGGALAVCIASLVGFKTTVDNRLRNLGFIIVGMTLGTNVSQDSLSLIRQWPVSMAGLVVVLITIIVVCTLVLTKVFKFDKATAYLSSFPGHLSFVLGVAESGYGNARDIAIIQSVRVLLLTILVPVAFRLFDHTGEAAITIARDPMAFIPLAILAIACVVSGFVFKAIRMPAAFVLGPMFTATTGKLMGLYDGQMPLILSLVGFVLMGALIGSRFSGVKLAEIRRALVGGLVNTIICVLVVSGVSEIVSVATDMPFSQIWLGLAPGALESMGALSFALGLDTAFVAAHHTARFFLLTLGVPTVGLIVGRKKDGEAR